MSKCVRNVLKTQRCDSVLSPIFFLFFNLIKTAAKFMRTESVKCPARAVFAKSRARHVHIMSLNLLTSHKSPLICRISYVHSSWTTDESLLQKSKRFRSLCRLRIPVKIVPRTPVMLGPRLYSRIETAGHLVRSDFFAKIDTKL